MYLFYPCIVWKFGWVCNSGEEMNFPQNFEGFAVAVEQLSDILIPDAF